jgi:O-antigen/teichoic acid export membrane protein
MSFVTKAINLIFNVLIARIISKESYGLATVYLGFIFIMLLHFPREVIRKTCQKFCPDKDEEIENKKYREACNLSWLLNFLVVICSIPIGLIFLHFGGNNLYKYKTHLYLYLFAVFLELLSEPIVIYMNIKMQINHRLIAMTMSNYTRIISIYLLALIFDLDLWAFTIARLIASSIYLFYTFYLAFFTYHLTSEVLVPNPRKIYNLIKYTTKSQSEVTGNEYNSEIKEIFFTFTKSSSIKMILTYTERMVLSFVLQIDDTEKADYSFVIENFAIIVRYFIEPAQDNFFNLINKIKHYKGLAVHNPDENTSDSTNNDSHINVKTECKSDVVEKELNETEIQGLKNNNNNTGSKENYSFKLLSLGLKIFFIFTILITCYIYLIGKELLIFVYTEKWGTDHTVSILQVYSLYVGISAINGFLESYANAIYSTEKMNTYNIFMLLNAFLLVFLSIFLAEYNITGLVWANIIVLLVRIVVNLYMILKLEIEFQLQNASSSLETSNTYFRIIIEIAKFLKKSFLKMSTFFSTIVCLILFVIIKHILIVDDSKENNSIFLLLICGGIIFLLNLFLIFILEKKEFVEVMRLKNVG